MVAAHQQITQEWWQNYSNSYDLCVSQLVLSEASDGNPASAERRLDVLREMTVLETSTPALEIAKDLIRGGALPTKASEDALHIAIAASHEIKFLLTWNCKHLANAIMRRKIEALCKSKGFIAPIICTPEELMDDVT